VKGLVLTGTASGVGKTVATLATLRAFESVGRTVGPAKAGPDFIDPIHHAAVADDARFAFDVERGTGIDGDREGLVEHRTLGTYCHVHAASGAFDAFLDEVER
jgi:cobyrinic acid a,c-diamide synthase